MRLKQKMLNLFQQRMTSVVLTGLNGPILFAGIKD